ncbi:hypothetical protein PRIPAC_95271, partial [Pristionchus pacificus]|uniref:Uncharacterized protein n=1 Tax=Pristionchus pacificus TaxID=54126 RepID=A0A2A6D1B7_PRIPA
QVMAEYLLEKADKERLVGLADQLSEKNKEKVVALAKKDRVTVEDIDDLGREEVDTLPLFAFFSTLKLAPRKVEEYKASAAFKEKTRRLRIRLEDMEYKRIIRDVDRSQNFGKDNLMEGFGKEMKAANKQVMSIFNVVITVVCGFFFGFSGVTYLYPHLEIDLSIRFAIGLVFATIIFFADLYFVLKGMDDFVMDDPVKPVKPERRPIPENPFADQIKKATEEVHSTNSEETKTVQNRKKPKMAN